MRDYHFLVFFLYWSWSYANVWPVFCLTIVSVL